MIRQRLRAAQTSDEGFTLIELLIVVVILGVLAGIAVFAVGAFNNEGVAAACKTDTKTLETAAEAYYAHEKHYPASADDLVKDKYIKEAPGNITVTYSTTAAPVIAAC